MPLPLKLLIVEDSADDTELIVRELRRADYAPEWSRVETEPDFLNSLSRELDLVISDYSMPRFNGLRAAQLLRQHCPEVPFILLSGTVGEEAAVEAMKQGATDYLLKDRIARLGSAVTRALEQRRFREERRRLEQQVQLQATALQTAANGIIITDGAGVIRWVNPAFSRTTGYQSEEVIGQTPRVLKSGQHDTAFYRQFWDTLRTGHVWQGEFINRRKDGSLYHDEHTVTPVRSGSGNITHFVAITHDVTERKRAQDAARQKQEVTIRHQTALLKLAARERMEFLSAVREILKVDAETLHVGRVSYWRLDREENRIVCEALYLAETDQWQQGSELRQREFPKYFAALETDPFIAAPDAQTDARTSEFAATYLRPLGIASMLDVPVWLHGSLVGVICHEHLGERRVWTSEEQDFALSIGHMVALALGEHELELREQQFMSFFANATAGLGILDQHFRFVQVNETLARINGSPVEAHLGRTVAELIPELAPTLEPLLQQVVTTGAPLLNLEISGQTPAQPGGQRFWTSSYFPLKGGRPGSLEIGAVVVEITERIRAEQALRESEEKFRQLAENINEVFWITDPKKNQMIYVSPAYQTIWGRTCESLLSSPRTWLEAIHPEDRERVLQAALSKQTTGEYDETYRITRLDGSVRWIHDCGVPLLDATGEVYRIVGTAADITDQRKLEEQLRQVQKMEAIGQLAGGVAHDFNNLLTVIRGGSDLLLMTNDRLPAESKDLIKQVIAAADRAANLTRQLLTFSRKQVVQTSTVNLNELIENLTKMLHRIIGEDIRLRCEYAAELPAVQADPGMLEQVIMNLVVNARDAMPNGGELSLATCLDARDAVFCQLNRPEPPGTYVCLRVSDQGCGIPPEVLPKIFEPFFTTKEAGKGTGLGLATVFGIVQQHRGWINVQSEVGKGTEFRVFLPAAPTQGTKLRQTLFDPDVSRGHETILLVEDEPSVRTLVRSILERHGYHVVEARSGKAALGVWEEHGSRIDLLMTDMVMPDGITGKMLAEKLREARPTLKVIYCSGYSPEVIGGDFKLAPESRFLQKPYNPHKLLKVLREALDGKNASDR